MKNPARSTLKGLALKIVWTLATGLALVLFGYAAYLPHLAARTNDVYWKAHYQPYFWRLLTDGESIALGMGLQALVSVATYGILTQAMPRRQSFSQPLRWALRIGGLLSFLFWPFWLLALLFF